ncbi:hypothetical protein HF521_001012 [Silurus meridionalis]|uniref:separase n=1 Tax=Silurus meridionalis TaxID=175797 RepID=A0A8T0BXF8_SILME|nr:hypothetical protein HF521_001012 [Silurus meridionalis]
MKCLKTEEYVQRISCVQDAVVLHDELEKHLKQGLGAFGRTACDRIIRACNQRLAGGAPDPELQEHLVDLVELAAHGYGAVPESRPRGPSLYLEKIIFHILQKLVAQQAHGPAGRLAEFMYLRLQGVSSQVEDFGVVARNCFAVLWNGSSGAQASRLSPRQQLAGQLQALRFRLLETTCSASCKVPAFVEEAVSEFERARGSLSQDDAGFILSEFRKRFFGADVERDCALTPPPLGVRCEAVVKVCKPLCKNRLWDEAVQLVDGATECVREGEGLRSALELTARAPRLHRDLGSGVACSETFTDCARILRALPPVLGDAETHALVEACQLVVWATEAGQTKGMGGATLLASFSFWEEYQEFLIKLQTGSFSQQLQYSLCFSLYQGFISTYDSLHTSQAVDMEKRLRAVREGSRTAADLDSVPTNDLEYEDKQKFQESQLVYDGLSFNLSEHSKHLEPLEKCLSLWATLLKDGSVPTVRDHKQTASSILLMAALYTLMGKALQALESYQLAASLFRLLGDVQNSAGASLHAATLLLDLGAPQLAQVQLDEAQQCLNTDTSTEGATILSVTNTLLRAQVCYASGQVETGVQVLCEVLKETALRHSKSWYMLKARALQTASAYLSLDTGTLHTHLRHTIIQHGLKTPDTTQYEALKLLCSLVMMLLGNGFYGAPGLNTDTRFVDQGDSVVFKWLLLSEVLLCSERMVRLRSSGGTAHEAKAQCLEALKLATKLHTLSHCAELLVLKAELELMKGAGEAGGLDLEQVRHLLDLCTDFGRQQQQKCEVKIKPRKGRPAVKISAPEVPEKDEEEMSGLLSSRALGREALEELSELGQDSSPPLKPKRQRMLSCLSHAEGCSCPCCTDPGLARVSVLWALAQADAQSEAQNSLRLRHVARLRCQNIHAKVHARLAELMPVKQSERPCMLQTEMVRAQLNTVLSQLCCSGAEAGKVSALWEELEAGLEAVKPKGALLPDLGHLKAALLGAKAVVCCLALAGKKQCSPDELFSSVWGWTSPKTKAQVKSRGKSSSSDGLLPATAPSGKNLTENKREAYMEIGGKKNKEVLIASSKKTKSSLPKISTTNSAVAFKTPRASRTPRPRCVSAVTPAGMGADLSAFDFTNEVPDITVSSTPLPSTKATTSSRCGVTRAKDAPKGSFQVFEDSSRLQEKPVPVPAAPRRTKRSRFKVEFSDESDAETLETRSENKISVPSAPKPSSKSSVSRVSAQDRPRRTRTVKKSTAPCTSGASSEEEPQPRRGRSRKTPSSDDVEIPERMRMDHEDQDGDSLDISLEKLQESVSEMVNTGSAADGDCEVLRRDLGADSTRDCVKELKSSGQTGIEIPLAHVAPGDLSVNGIRSLLTSSWLLLHHFPHPSLYSHLCSLLAQSLGQSDPITTAMLHSQALGVSSRHHMTRHLANRLRKLKKSGDDVAETLSGLSLDESPSQTQVKTLSVLESIYSFTCTQPAQFPHTHCTEFTQQLEHLPAGVTVCLISLVGACPGEIGSTILITRLERDSAPITMRILTAHSHPMTMLLEEMEAVLQGQKKVSTVADKVQWWEGRKSLDARVQKLLEDMEEALGVWRVLLLPLTSDPELPAQMKRLKSSVKETKITADMLKVVLSAAPLLSLADLQSLSEGACLHHGDFLKLLQKSVCELRERQEPHGHTVLVLDKYLQKLPWENISCLKPRSVTRMPSLQAVLGHSHLRQVDPDCVLSRGIDPQRVYFVLNPDGNLPETEKRFRDWFTGERAWQGVCGAPPDPDQLQEAVTTKDLYIYVGHGAGARFLDTQRLLRGNVHAAALLFGCSSAALSVQGNLEGTGITLSYLTAGCPLVLGNLWDVTDRDIDRFTSALLQSWLSGGSGSSLLQHLVQSRDSTHLKHMIGAAPVAYGLPVHLR